ncbi:MAG: hypothetical protein ACXAD7_29000, partial [Candidatus Kariarchaeaceae archaeon]
MELVDTNDNPLPPGRYDVIATYDGIEDKYSASNTTLYFEILPDLIDVRYVADVDGDDVTFTVRNDNYESGFTDEFGNPVGEILPDFTINFSVQLTHWVTSIDDEYLEWLVGTFLNTTLKPANIFVATGNSQHLVFKYGGIEYYQWIKTPLDTFDDIVIPSFVRDVINTSTTNWNTFFASLEYESYPPFNWKDLLNPNYYITIFRILAENFIRLVFRREFNSYLVLMLKDGAFQDIKGLIRDGLGKFITTGIALSNDINKTDSNGQFKFSFKDYVFNNLRDFLYDGSSADSSLDGIRKALQAVEGKGYSAIEQLSRSLNWITSLNEFVFYFDLRTTEPYYHSMVDADFGYQKFLISGTTARRYITPYFVNSLDTNWDTEGKFFISIPREILQEFRIDIDEFVDQSLTLSNQWYELDGFLDIPNNQNQSIYLYQEYSGTYVEIATLKTGG